jgi:pimeloyl-ACP methyl ester carboxylesterase
MERTVEPRVSTFLGLGPHGFHRLVYTEWGNPQNPVLLCVHGLTRNGRDFDELASALCATRRVVCPDMPGRGRSDWLPSPADYLQPLYLADLTALIARLRADALDWLGTSMGGILGMVMAAQPGSPVRRLVLNDIGPSVPRAALQRIGTYAGAAPPFRSLAEAEAYLRVVHEPFGALTDEQWARMARHSAELLPDGSWRLRYDPAIALPLRTGPLADVDLWSVWEAVACPVLVLRGADSDVLTRETAEEMQRRKPGTRTIEIPKAGHAPALQSPEEISHIREWLDAG